MLLQLLSVSSRVGAHGRVRVPYRYHGRVTVGRKFVVDRAMLPCTDACTHRPISSDLVTRRRCVCRLQLLSVNSQVGQVLENAVVRQLGLIERVWQKKIDEFVFSAASESTVAICMTRRQ